MRAGIADNMTRILNKIIKNRRGNSCVLEKQNILNPSILKIVKEEIEKKFVSIKELEERVLARLQKEGYLSQDKLIGALAVGAIIIGSILYSSPAY